MLPTVTRTAPSPPATSCAWLYSRLYLLHMLGIMPKNEPQIVDLTFSASTPDLFFTLFTQYASEGWIKSTILACGFSQWWVPARDKKSRDYCWGIFPKNCQIIMAAPLYQVPFPYSYSPWPLETSQSPGSFRPGVWLDLGYSTIHVGFIYHTFVNIPFIKLPSITTVECSCFYPQGKKKTKIDSNDDKR